MANMSESAGDGSKNQPKTESLNSALEQIALLIPHQ
jgi:hypothetical protein